MDKRKIGALGRLRIGQSPFVVAADCGAINPHPGYPSGRLILVYIYMSCLSLRIVTRYFTTGIISCLVILKVRVERKEKKRKAGKRCIKLGHSRLVSLVKASNGDC